MSPLAMATARNLYTLSSMPTFGDRARSALTGIQNTLQGAVDPKGKPIEVPGLTHLGNHPDDTSEILCAIAKDRQLLNIICKDENLLHSLTEGVEGFRPDTSDVENELRNWAAFQASRPPAAPLYSPLARTNFSLNPLLAPMTALSVLGLLGGALCGSDLLPALTLAAWVSSGLFMATRHQAQSGTEMVLEAAAQSRVDQNTYRGYFSRFGRLSDPVPRSSHPSPQTLPECIASSANPGGNPTLSRTALYTIANDLCRLGTIATESLQRDPTGRLYDHVAPGFCLALLSGVHWQPALLHPERLEELRSLQEEGARILVLGNHRSYLDILAMAAIMGSLRPRIIAKYQLLNLPIIGFSPVHHPLNRKKWIEDGLLKAAGHVVIKREDPTKARQTMERDALDVLRKGHALCIYDEGTRLDTEVRGFEIGRQPSRRGAFKTALASAREGRTFMTSLQIFGLGSSMPASPGQILEGLRLHQPCALGIAPIIEVSADENARDLQRQVWRNNWKILSAMQFAMNQRAQFSPAIR